MKRSRGLSCGVIDPEKKKELIEKKLAEQKEKQKKLAEQKESREN